MLLNQVTTLENQLQMSNMTQSQPMGMNSNNMLAMVNLLNAGQSSKPTMKNEFKGGKALAFKGGKALAKPTMNMNSNLANLLTSLTGGEEPKQRTRCVWVTGLPEDYQDADKLLNLFGNFGNIRKIVFSEKVKDGALIELDDSRGSFKAKVNMNGQKLDGKEIKVSYAKIDHAGMNNDARSKDLRDAKENWRFSNNKEAKFRKICMSRLKKLSSSVTVLNVPEGKSDQLKKHIIESGYTVKSIEGSQRPEAKDKPSTGYTVAFVELASVEEAIAAVANLHNTWPKKFGAMKNDVNGNARGLAFYLAGVKQEKPKA
jgi:hypothetical protein